MLDAASKELQIVQDSISSKPLFSITKSNNAFVSLKLVQETLESHKSQLDYKINQLAPVASFKSTVKKLEAEEKKWVWR